MSSEWLKPSTVLKERFSIDKLLKPTEMSKIYLAKDLSSGASVVIKQANTSGNSSLDRLKVEQLMIESKILSTIDHPNIVRYLDSWKTENDFFLVVNFVSARSLSEEYAKTRPQIELTGEYILELLEILEYLHGKGIVHKDVKPGNVLVGDQLTLLDFGIAQTARNSKKTQVRMGTPGYQCPEIFEKKTITPACDLFSAAATLFFLLTGDRPPHSDWEISSAGVKGKALAVAKRGMSHDISKRYSNVSEMRMQLLRIIPDLQGPLLFTGKKLHEITKDRLTIGRGNEADVHIEDPMNVVSPLHAEVWVEGSKAWLKDVSLNGTFLYHQKQGYMRIKKQQLRDGDTIVLCFNPDKGPYKMVKFRSAEILS